MHSKLDTALVVESNNGITAVGHQQDLISIEAAFAVGGMRFL